MCGRKLQRSMTRPVGTIDGWRSRCRGRERRQINLLTTSLTQNWKDTRAESQIA